MFVFGARPSAECRLFVCKIERFVTVSWITCAHDECDPNSVPIDQRPVCIAADHAGDNLVTAGRSVLDKVHASNSAVLTDAR